MKSLFEEMEMCIRDSNAYDAQSGFLTGFGAEMLAALLTTTLTVAKPGTDGGGSETVQDLSLIHI